MAALHFRNADEDISQLSREYFAGLNALDDHASVPEGFDRTAFAAVTHAVAQLGTGVGNSDRDRKQTQGLIYHAAFLAPELIPLNLLLQTVKEEARIDLTDPPAPEVADQGQRNKVLVNLRTQTIATRRSYIDPVGVSNPASDTISIHPLVHEILRSIYRQQAPLEQTLKLLTMLMACAYGWIIKLRREGTAFPLSSYSSMASGFSILLTRYRYPTMLMPTRFTYSAAPKCISPARLRTAQHPKASSNAV